MKKFISALVLTSLVFALSVVPALALDTGLSYGTYTGLGTKDLREGVMSIIRYIMTFLGVIALIIVLYGGFVWMTAAGNEENVSKAKKIITAGIIGLVVIFVSYAIVAFVINQLISATGAV